MIRFRLRTDTVELGQDTHLSVADGQVRGRRACTEKVDPRREGECRAEALRAVQVSKTHFGSLAKARDAYNRGEIEVSDETRRVVPRLTRTTCKRWNRNFKDKRLNGLIPRRGNRAGSGVMDLDAELSDFVIAILGENHLLSSKLIWLAMREAFPEAEKRLPACGAFRRWLRRWKLSHREHFSRISNPDSHKSRFRVSLGRKADEVCHPMEIVEIDGSPADILCTDGRYYLTVAIDIFTRRLVAVVSKTASATAALLCVRKMILTLAVPKTLRHDRGSEYKAARFQGALHHCEIISDMMPAFSGDKKPFVERVIGTIMHSFMPLLPGYIGPSPAARKSIESKKSLASRLGESQNERFSVSLSAHELQQRLDAWISEVYSNNSHAGLNGRTPNQSWREAVAAGWKAHRLPERELDVLLADAGVRRVGKKGVRIEHADFWADELVEYAGKQVRVSLTDDMGAIVLFNTENEFVAVAKNPERAGISRREMSIGANAAYRASQREAKQADRARKNKYTPGRVLDAMTASRGIGAPPLTVVELHNVPMLRAAAESIEAGNHSAPSRIVVESATSSDRRFQKYLKLKKKPFEKLTDEEKMQLRLFEGSAAFRARITLGAAVA